MNSITPVNGLVAGVTIMGGAASAQGTVANNKVNISIVGCGNRCKEILDGFKKRDDVNIVSCCDPRKQRREQLAAMTGGDPVEDMRTVLDDKRVDAIFAPLPDHWHALAVFWACKAGKDIYVEKPLTHDPFEGVQCVKAARKYKRIVQHGTQNLSAPYNIEAKKYIKDGKLGDIHLIRVFDMQSGGGLNIKKGEKVPDGFNYDYWLGPVPDVPYSSSIVNHGWHSLWDFSAGDMADDGIHQLDLARWLIDKEYPNSAYSAGGRFNNISDAQTPDTMVTTYEYDDMKLEFLLYHYPQYMIKTPKKDRESDVFQYLMQNGMRIEIFGTKGLMTVCRHGGGWQVFSRPKNREPNVVASCHGRIPTFLHQENFINCVRTRELPNADVEIGHKSSMLVHYAMISHRLGGVKLNINATDGTIKNPEAAKYWKRDYRNPYVIPEEV